MVAGSARPARPGGEALTYNEDWEREAANWIAFARAPGTHDAYGSYSPAFFELVPSAGRATLELGCGEGRVARDLAARGHRVTAIDAAPTLVDAARAADPRGTYLLADAADLPFDDASFDLVVAYNSLMDVQDLPGTVAEAGRVLEPGGRLCACVTHPLMDAGRFESREPDAPFVITDSYFERRRYEETFARGGLQMTFHGWCYPLEAYFRAFEAAGLAVEALREPGAMEKEDPRHARVPLFLLVRATRA